MIYAEDWLNITVVSHYLHVITNGYLFITKHIELSQMHEIVNIK